MDWLADQILIFEILVSPYLKDGLQEEAGVLSLWVEIGRCIPGEKTFAGIQVLISLHFNGSIRSSILRNLIQKFLQHNIVSIFRGLPLRIKLNLAALIGLALLMAGPLSTIRPSEADRKE